MERDVIIRLFEQVIQMPNLVVLIFQPNKPEETLVEVFENIPDTYDREARKPRDGVLLLSDQSALFDLSESHHVFAQVCAWIHQRGRSHVAIYLSGCARASISLAGESLPVTKASLKAFLDRDARSDPKGQ